MAAALDWLHDHRDAEVDWHVGDLAGSASPPARQRRYFGELGGRVTVVARLVHAQLLEPICFAATPPMLDHARCRRSRLRAEVNLTRSGERLSGHAAA